MRPRVYI
ncbi:hypothetical protein Zm00014a_031745 [Zea mays]|nr:hypothetical protein Zm00014a_031745 [Zea mays]